MTTDPVSTLRRALVAAQAQMPFPPKDAENPHLHNRFTSLGALIAATRPVLNQFGIALTQFPGMDEQGRPVLRTTLTHGPSGEEITDVTPLFLSGTTSQAHGSAITYARRYAWAALLGIASEEDTDGNAPANPHEPARTRTNPPERPEAPVAMASKPQKAKMGVQVKHLEAAGVPIPDGYPGAESWTDVLRVELGERYKVTTRTDLTSKQASEVIDWLEAQAIPF